MPIKWLLTPTGEHLSFEEAPSWYEERGLMPASAVEAVIAENTEDKPAFHVRPSDVNPKFVCRRKRVWESNHDYGIYPLEAEGMVEGTAFHDRLKTQEIEVPAQVVGTIVLRNNGASELVPYEPGGFIPIAEGDVVVSAGRVEANRVEVCGTPMRGRIDWLDPERITDLKNKTPFWYPKFGAKGSGERASAAIWEPKDDADDVLGYKIQLSIYRVLLEKSGQEAPKKGRVWRRYQGVKADKGRYKRYDFDLLSEEELEAVAGPWIRGLRDGLELASTSMEAWRNATPDGREMVGSKGNLWNCDRCQLREECSRESGWSTF